MKVASGVFKRLHNKIEEAYIAYCNKEKYPIPIKKVERYGFYEYSENPNTIKSFMAETTEEKNLNGKALYDLKNEADKVGYITITNNLNIYLRSINCSSLVDFMDKHCTEEEKKQQLLLDKEVKKNKPAIDFDLDKLNYILGDYITYHQDGKSIETGFCKLFIEDSELVINFKTAQVYKKCSIQRITETIVEAIMDNGMYKFWLTLFRKYPSSEHNLIGNYTVFNTYTNSSQHGVILFTKNDNSEITFGNFSYSKIPINSETLSETQKKVLVFFEQHKQQTYINTDVPGLLADFNKLFFFETFNFIQKELYFGYMYDSEGALQKMKLILLNNATSAELHIYRNDNGTGNPYLGRCQQNGIFLILDLKNHFGLPLRITIANNNYKSLQLFTAVFSGHKTSDNNRVIGLMAFERVESNDAFLEKLKEDIPSYVANFIRNKRIELSSKIYHDKNKTPFETLKITFEKLIGTYHFFITNNKNEKENYGHRFYKLKLEFNSDFSCKLITKELKAYEGFFEMENPMIVHCKLRYNNEFISIYLRNRFDDTFYLKGSYSGIDTHNNPMGGYCLAEKIELKNYNDSVSEHVVLESKIIKEKTSNPKFLINYFLGVNDYCDTFEFMNELNNILQNFDKIE